MSESLRDLLRQGADTVERPQLNMDELVARTQSRLVRRRLAAVAASAAMVGLVAAGAFALRPDDGHLAPAPAPTQTENPPTIKALSLEGTPYAALAAGSHSAPNFWPPLTYTAPDGWLTEPAAEGLLALVPDTTKNRERIRAGGFPSTFLNVLPNVSVAAEDCAQASAPGVGLVAGDIVGALATRSGLSTSGPVAITIGGLSGQQIDVSLASDWTGTCSGGGPFVPLVYSPDFIWWGAEPGERFRITVLDVPNLPSGMYATVMIVDYSSEAAAWADHLSASTRLIESFEFDTTPPHP